jgi:hypothetical protein
MKFAFALLVLACHATPAEFKKTTIRVHQEPLQKVDNGTPHTATEQFDEVAQLAGCEADSMRCVACAVAVLRLSIAGGEIGRKYGNEELQTASAALMEPSNFVGATQACFAEWTEARINCINQSDKDKPIDALLCFQNGP